MSYNFAAHGNFIRAADHTLEVDSPRWCEICAQLHILPLFVLTAAAASGEPHVLTPTLYGLQLRRLQQPRMRDGSHSSR
jgi:hypothetical protein